MLIRYKNSFEKIAMGLLAFMPEEKNVKKLQQTIKKYEESDRWQLYLWKEADAVVAIIGITILENEQVQVNHICVNPSYREEGIGTKMVVAIKDLYKEKEVIAGINTISFFDKCNGQQSDC